MKKVESSAMKTQSLAKLICLIITLAALTSLNGMQPFTAEEIKAALAERATDGLGLPSAASFAKVLKMQSKVPITPEQQALARIYAKIHNPNASVADLDAEMQKEIAQLKVDPTRLINQKIFGITGFD